MSKTRVACKVCKGPLPPVAIQHADLYCSATCSRKAHKNPLPESSIWSRHSHTPRKGRG